MHLEKIVVIGLVSILFALSMPLLGEEQAIETPRNIQIIVEMRQAGYENLDGRERTSRSTQTQFIVVREGAEGRIFIGEKVPYVAYYYDFLTREGYLAGSVAFQDVGTSLIVTARVVGHEIEVTLTPEISYETQGGHGRIAVQKLSTSVRVPEGQSIEIGGNISKSEFNDNFYRSRSGQTLQIVLTPKIL
jgi:hypothetical protein